ncbi:MAG TPA: ATP-binding protein [Candidatus Acidoferrales bacterium]|nr:ATP-binding protein [Candidatus Acidoferrales bacterium]
MAERPPAPRAVPPAPDPAPAAAPPHPGFFFEEAFEPMFVCDPVGRLLHVNRSACELMGYSREELLGMRVPDLLTPESLRRDPFPAPDLTLPASLVKEREMVRRDGSRILAELSIRYLVDGSSLAIIHDVTQHHQQIDALRRALSLVQSTLESTTDGILVVNREGRFAGYNRKFVEMWRIAPEFLASDDNQKALEFAVSQLADPEGFMARVRELYAQPEASTHDELHLRDGRVFERYSIPQRLGSEVVGRVWSFRDVTAARRQSEALRESEQRLLAVQKLEAVGRLAGGVAHDFNNMLTAILGEADLLLLRPELPEDARRQVQNIRSAALRSARLTRQLLAFARRQHTEPRALDLRDLVEGLDALVRRLAGRSSEVRLELPERGAGPWVVIDPTQLEQAILNLVINAGDAMAGGGLLRIRLERVSITPQERAGRGARRDGPHARLSVIDTGHGIPEHVKPNLFEPFFTTKPPGKGTGLGLASVHGIVVEAQGFIEVESGAGGGATFHLFLPECEPRPGAAAPAPAAAPGVPALPPRVLVVDDDERVRRLVVAMLENAGIEVRTAGGAGEAMELARREPRALDLLLTDVRMPGIGGPAIARQLLAEGLVRRVMFMSGFGGETLREDLAGLGRVLLVGKPFRAEELVARVLAEIS